MRSKARAIVICKSCSGFFFRTLLSRRPAVRPISRSRNNQPDGITVLVLSGPSTPLRRDLKKPAKLQCSGASASDFFVDRAFFRAAGPQKRQG